MSGSVIVWRMAFMPPPVEPAQPPINEQRIRKIGKKMGQLAKSVVANPVVVPMDIAWKIPCAMASSGAKTSITTRYRQLTLTASANTPK